MGRENLSDMEPEQPVSDGRAEVTAGGGRRTIEEEVELFLQMTPEERARTDTIEQATRESREEHEEWLAGVRERYLRMAAALDALEPTGDLVEDGIAFVKAAEMNFGPEEEDTRQALQTRDRFGIEKFLRAIERNSVNPPFLEGKPERQQYWISVANVMKKIFEASLSK